MCGKKLLNIVLIEERHVLNRDVTCPYGLERSTVFMKFDANAFLELKMPKT